MNPDLGLDFYTGLLKEAETRWPGVKLHACWTPDGWAWLARAEKMSYRDVLTQPA
jgi:2-iminoacetate synthase ThiH